MKWFFSRTGVSFVDGLGRKEKRFSSHGRNRKGKSGFDDAKEEYRDYNETKARNGTVVVSFERQQQKQCDDMVDKQDKRPFPTRRRAQKQKKIFFLANRAVVTL
jgi:hypothetical protein